MKEGNNSDQESDRRAIDQLADRFFSLFTNKDGKSAEVSGAYDLFIPRGLIINNSGDTPAIYDLEGFITPREELLSNGSLVDFSEWEVEAETEIRGNIAHRTCTYEKSGTLNGEQFEGRGKKMMHFVKFDGNWKMCSVIWSDEG